MKGVNRGEDVGEGGVGVRGCTTSWQLVSSAWHGSAYVHRCIQSYNS